MALVLTLSLFAAPIVWAADAPVPAKGANTIWAGIEGWFQDLLAGWFGPQPLERVYATDQQCPPDPPMSPQDGGGGGVSTTDAGNESDPNG